MKIDAKPYGGLGRARFAIIGSRKEKLGDLAKDYESAVRFYVRRLPRDTTVVSGGATGVDYWAESEAVLLNLATKSFPVDREGLPPYGLPGSREEFARRAHARNQQIVDYSDVVIAFWDGKSPGTRDCLKRAQLANMPWAIITPNGDEIHVRTCDNLNPSDLYIVRGGGH